MADDVQNENPTLSYGAQLLRLIFAKKPKDTYSANCLPELDDSLHTKQKVDDLQTRAMKA